MYIIYIIFLFLIGLFFGSLSYINISKHQKAKIKFLGVLTGLFGFLIKFICYIFLIKYDITLLLLNTIISILLFFFHGNKILIFLYKNSIFFFFFELHLKIKLFFKENLKSHKLYTNVFIGLFIFYNVYLYSCCFFSNAVVINYPITNFLLTFNTLILFPTFSIYNRLLSLPTAEDFDNIFKNIDELSVQKLYIGIFSLLLPKENLKSIKNKRFVHNKIGTDLIKRKLLNESIIHSAVAGLVGGAVTSGVYLYNGKAQDSVSIEANRIAESSRLVLVESNRLAAERMAFEIKNQKEMVERLKLDKINEIKLKAYEFSTELLHTETGEKKILNKTKYLEFLANFGLDTEENIKNSEKYASKFEDINQETSKTWFNYLIDTFSSIYHKFF